jgi:hypothetical protein
MLGDQVNGVSSGVSEIDRKEAGRGIPGCTTSSGSKGLVIT